MPRKKVNETLKKIAKKDFKKNIKVVDSDVSDISDIHAKYLESFIYKDMDYETKHMIRSATVNPDGTITNFRGEYILVRKRKGVRRSRRPKLPIPPEDIMSKYYSDEDDDDDIIEPELEEDDYDEYDDEEDIDEDDETSESPASFNSDNVNDVKAKMTSSIDSIESVLMKYKDDKDAIDETYRSKQRKEYHTEPLFKPVDKKQKKKERKALLENVFNNSPDDDDEDSENRLDTTYGKRFAPVVEYIFDTINEFDNIADSIQNELANNKANTKGMYYTSQIGNLISARNSKLSAIKELTNISKTISDIEYKREKDNKKDDEKDLTKNFIYMGAQYLRGALNNDRDDDCKNDDNGDSDVINSGSSSHNRKDKKRKKKDKKVKNGKKKKKSKNHDDDDDDTMSVEYVNDKKSSTPSRNISSKSVSNSDDVFNAIMSKRNVELNPYEQFIEVEGTYKFVVVADAEKPDDDWTFVAVDPKTDKKIKGFKEKYKALYPDKKLCKMYFNLERMKAIDKATNKSYQLFLK